MLIISLVTVFPELYTHFLQASLIKRAIEKKLIAFNLVSFSQFCEPKERIDEPVVGPGAGMILKPLVVERAIEYCFEKYGKGSVLFFSPQGELLSQDVLTEIYGSLKGSCNAFFNSMHAHDSGTATSCSAHEDSLALEKNTNQHLILICSRYEGVDKRLEDYYADWILSVGNFVVMGGDIPAQLFIEGFLRLVPGVVGNAESVEHDSFQGPFLDYPAYGLPVLWRERVIPAIVQSGNHAAIEDWRMEQAAQLTIERNFSWFSGARPTQKDCDRLRAYIPRHYLAIMHTEVLLKNGTVGQTSIPSLDIHDTARACATYGIENFFIVSPLNDQQEIVQTFMDFWQSDVGKKYNQTRYQALQCVKPVYSFDEMLAAIQKKEGQLPLIVATSAQTHNAIQSITYDQQSELWAQKRPILFIFGTGQGLSDAAIARCDYMLEPIDGLTGYNHLSVRSAIAIILDRWLGLHPKKRRKIKKQIVLQKSKA